MSEEASTFDPSRERGMHNSRMLDLIQLSADGEKVELHMIEYRSWCESFQNDLEEKFNNYLDYVLDGHLVNQYPQYQGKLPTIVLQYSEEPTSEVQTLLSVMERYVSSIGWKFETRPRNETE